MHIRLLRNSGVLLSRILPGLLVMLVAVGASVPASPVPCPEREPERSAGGAQPGVLQPSVLQPIRVQSDAGAPAGVQFGQSGADVQFGDVTLAVAPSGGEAVSASPHAGPPAPQCRPVSGPLWGATSATVRSARPLSDHLRPRGGSASQDAALPHALPHARWGAAAPARPPRGLPSESPPAQESMGTLRSVVLRL